MSYRFFFSDISNMKPNIMWEQRKDLVGKDPGNEAIGHNKRVERKGCSYLCLWRMFTTHRRYCTSWLDLQVIVDHKRYHCSECTNYDCCAVCFEKSAHADHYMYLENQTPQEKSDEVSNWRQSLLISQIKKCPTVCDVFRKAFSIYAHRPCLGYRAVVDGQLSKTFTWLSYETIGERVSKFGYGLRSLEGVEPGCVVGICAENCLEVTLICTKTYIPVVCIRYSLHNVWYNSHWSAYGIYGWWGRSCNQPS
jgi:hypothetical protein